MSSRLHYIFLLFFCLSIGWVYGQQRPISSLNPISNFLLNPSVAGIEKYTDLKVGSRWQWVNIDGAPVTQFISIHKPIGDNFIGSNVNTSPDNNDWYANRYSYQSAERHHGIGLIAYHDSIGSFSRSELDLAYAFHLPINNKLNVSVGVNVGWSVLSIDRNKIRVQDQLDPTILGLKDQYNFPNLGLGFWVYGPYYYFGVGGQDLLPYQARFGNNNDQAFTFNHYQISATGGIKLPLLYGVDILPSILVRYSPALPLSIDASARVNIQNRLWLATTYRFGDSIIVVAGIFINHTFNISYSYDYTVSSLSASSGGSHEFILGILLSNPNQVRCPKNLW